MSRDSLVEELLLSTLKEQRLSIQIMALTWPEDFLDLLQLFEQDLSLIQTAIVVRELRRACQDSVKQHTGRESSDECLQQLVMHNFLNGWRLPWSLSKHRALPSDLTTWLCVIGLPKSVLSVSQDIHRLNPRYCSYLLSNTTPGEALHVEDFIKVLTQLLQGAIGDIYYLPYSIMDPIWKGDMKLEADSSHGASEKVFLYGFCHSALEGVLRVVTPLYMRKTRSVILQHWRKEIARLLMLLLHRANLPRRELSILHIDEWGQWSQLRKSGRDAPTTLAIMIEYDPVELLRWCISEEKRRDIRPDKGNEDEEHNIFRGTSWTVVVKGLQLPHASLNLYASWRVPGSEDGALLSSALSTLLLCPVL